MAQVTIRNLDDRVVERLKKLAAANGRSLEAELRFLLGRLAKGDIAVAEEVPTYEASARVARPLPDAQAFSRPKIVRYPPVTPVKVKGKLASERLIEDRR